MEVDNEDIASNVRTLNMFALDFQRLCARRQERRRSVRDVRDVPGVCFFIDVKSIIKPKGDLVRACCEYAKIVVKRINDREKLENAERRQ